MSERERMKERMKERGTLTFFFFFSFSSISYFSPCLSLPLSPSFAAPYQTLPRRIDLVTINPNFVLGPALSAADGGSISVGYVKGMVEGSSAAGGSLTICDVRDVARAHVVAAEDPGAKGRYIVSQPGAVLPGAIAAAIRGAVRDAGFEAEAALLPEAEAPPAGESGKARIDASRTVNELGVFLRPPEETLRDAARSLIKLGVAVPASKVKK